MCHLYSLNHPNVSGHVQVVGTECSEIMANAASGWTYAS